MTNPTMLEVQTKIAELQDALLSKHPRIPTLLSDIHKTLKQYPECVTLLTPEEISEVIRGLESHTQTNLASSITAGAKKSAAKSSLLSQLKKLGADAI